MTTLAGDGSRAVRRVAPLGVGIVLLAVLSGCTPRAAKIDLARLQERKFLPITDEEIPGLVPADSTVNLDAHGLAIGDAAMKHIASCRNLKLVDLSASNVTDEGLRHLCVLSHLESLRLNDNNITDAGLCD